ncbi:11083_t:CDS:2, partial [Acaulospora colombiana]
KMTQRRLMAQLNGPEYSSAKRPDVKAETSRPDSYVRMAGLRGFILAFQYKFSLDRCLGSLNSPNLIPQKCNSNP